MVGKIIVASILAVLSFICMMLALYENTTTGETDKIRAFYGIMIGMSAIVLGVSLTALIFIIK